MSDSQTKAFTNTPIGSSVGLAVEAVADLGQVSVSGVAKTVKFAAVSVSAITDNEVVAAVTGKKIRVLSYVLNGAGGLNTATWKTAATALAGAMDIADNTSFSANSTVGLFETVAAEALNLALTAATLVAGHITYVEI